jgi:protein-tyrosine phosphatase
MGLMPIRVCFVCSGNICRSPTAEVVFRQLAVDAGRAEQFVVDSAGTGDWHAGDEMDRRSRATLAAAGYRPGRHAAKQFGPSDFADRDVVVALDRGHQRALLALAELADDPAAARAKVVLLRSYDPGLGPSDLDDLDVPDPYYGGADGFGTVLGQIARSSAGLLRSLVRPTETAQPDPTQPAQ